MYLLYIFFMVMLNQEVFINDKQLMMKKIIEKVRRELQNIIREKGNLTDPYVVTASKRLDRILNLYNRLAAKGDDNIEN